MACGIHRKPADAISDRAHRYRAQRCAPPGPKQCAECGSKRFVVIDHQDGEERNGRRSNLRWLCKSCNTRLGAEMARTGKGRRTMQYNPGSGPGAESGAKSLAQYATAAAMHTRGAHDAGGKIIHDTPPAKRSRYARQIAAIKRQRGTDKFREGNPYVMAKKDGKPAGAILGNILWNANDLENLRYASIGDGHTYEFVNTTTRGKIRIGRGKMSGNPTAQSYLLAAKKAAESGDYIKTTKLLTKYGTRKLKETAPKVSNTRYDPRDFSAALDAARKYAARAGKPTNLVVTNIGWRITHLSPAYAQPAFKVYPDGRHEEITKGYRGNPDQGAKAAQLYKDFHGKPSREVIRLHDALLKAGDYTALGNDPEFWLEPVTGDPAQWPKADIEFIKSDKVKLATDSRGKHLYIVGGNQKMPAELLRGLETDGRIVNLGTCYGISYQTEKIFDSFQTTTYAHEFGEETGERPELHYDTETQRLLIVGGAYHIAGVDKALKASPGIVN